MIIRLGKFQENLIGGKGVASTLYPLACTPLVRPSVKDIVKNVSDSNRRLAI